MNYLYLFFVSFISATLFPLGSEALLLYNLSLDLNIYSLFFIATFGNSMGSFVNYWLGLKGEQYLIDKKLLKVDNIIRSKKYFDKYGSYTLLLSWVPIIGDPITFMAGVLKYNIKKFIVLIIIAKGGRYIFIIASYKYLI
jgi:membrane protein YqaA with SNARE-associated domain